MPTKRIGNATDANNQQVPKPKGGFRHKMMIVTLVERDGYKRSFQIPTVNAGTLAAIRKSQVASLSEDSLEDRRRKTLPL